MKVLHVSTHFNIGGISNYILNLSLALKKKGVETVIASSGGDLEDVLAKYGIRHEKVDIRTKFEISPKIFLALPRLCGIAKENDIEVIHAHSRVSQVAAFFVSRITGVPYVTTCHGYFKKRMRGIFDTWGLRVIAISDAVRTHLIEDLGVDADRVELIYSGLDTEGFSKAYSGEGIAGFKSSLGLGAGPVIGHIGRLSPVKGQRFLVRAMKDIIAKRPDARALVVGSGKEGPGLKRLAGSLGVEDAVFFAPADPDTAKFLSLMDIFVFPSVKEGLGIGLLEALAAGKACVASDVGGIGSIIKDGVNGLLVPAGDPGAIAQAVLCLLGDAGLRRTMGANGRALVREKFTLDTMAEKVVELYGRVIGS